MTAPQSPQQAGPVLGEQIAARVHEAWMETKRAQGITSRPSEWGEEQMVPYTELSERAKDLDRGTVRAVLAAIAALDMMSALDGRVRVTGLSAATDAAFPGLPAGMTREQAERRIRAALDAVAPSFAALLAQAYANGVEAGRGDMERLEREWRADERREAHAEWSAPTPPGGAGGFITPECTDCPRIRDCRAQGYCNRTDRVLPRVTVLSYTPPSGTGEEGGT